MAGTLQIRLPGDRGVLEEYSACAEAPLKVQRGVRFKCRVAYAAAHVIADPLSTVDPISQTAIDWKGTLAFRRQLWGQGFAIAEAMDTAQRGMGLTWTGAKELIRLSCLEARAEGGTIACGANTDQAGPKVPLTLEGITSAYEEQCSYIQECGGRIILMASRALAQSASSPEDYRQVYGRILSQVEQPVILHWLGEAFDPKLRGYWGTEDVSDAMKICLSVIEDHRAKIDGIKISLLDSQLETQMRRLLPPGVRMYTGDDFNYPTLIAGDRLGHSDALLGIFDGIAPTATAAFQALDAGDMAQYEQLMNSTLPLSRHIFHAPTVYYKTGLVFLSYLNGWQEHFHMLGGQQSARSITHLALLFRYADQARLLLNQELAFERMRNLLHLAGI